MQKHYVSRKPVTFWSMTNERCRTGLSGKYILLVLWQEQKNIAKNIILYDVNAT